MPSSGASKPTPQRRSISLLAGLLCVAALTGCASNARETRAPTEHSTRSNGSTGAPEDDSALYINYSPDMRYSWNGRDARIALMPGQSLFAFGHDFGRTAPCEQDITSCIAFGGMALARPPADAEAGDRFRHGDFAFDVEGVETISVFGVTKEVMRITVRRRGETSNHYLYSRTDGVVAIGYENPDRSHVREFLFLLVAGRGVLRP